MKACGRWSQNRSQLLQLPDELLHPILELAALRPPVRSGLAARALRVDMSLFQLQHDKESIRILCQVCFRLYTLAHPLLYRAVNFHSSKSVVPPSQAVVKLHRTLKERPELQQFCRSLRIYFSANLRRTTRSRDFAIALDLTNWLQNTKSLLLDGHMNFLNHLHGMVDEPRTQFWNLMRVVRANMTELEHLTFNGGPSTSVYIDNMFHLLNSRSMKTLEVAGISQRLAEFMDFDLKDRRKASFTQLRLMNPSLPPETISTMIQWPAVLTHFECGNIFDISVHLDHCDFEPLLLVHRHTLKHLRLGYFPSHFNEPVFNATLFPCLESLQLSRWNMPSPMDFSHRDGKLLGPSLKVFIWDFETCGLRSEHWADFQPTDRDWLRELASAATIRSVPLQCVKIKFSPSFSGYRELVGYPWDMMDEVRDEHMRPNGIDLIYNEPPLSLNAFLKLVPTAKSNGKPTRIFDA